MTITPEDEALLRELVYFLDRLIWAAESLRSQVPSPSIESESDSTAFAPAA